MVTLLVSICFINACSYIKNPHPFGLYRGMEDGAPEGSENFRMGWKDGCQSGMSAYGSLHYKSVYDYKYDESKIKNKEYYDAWRMGFRYCRWYTGEWIR